LRQNDICAERATTGCPEVDTFQCSEAYTLMRASAEACGDITEKEIFEVDDLASVTEWRFDRERLAPLVRGFPLVDIYLE
jgi:hypothetical protein